MGIFRFLSEIFMPSAKTRRHLPIILGYFNTDFHFPLNSYFAT